MFVVPSWSNFAAHCDPAGPTTLDLFRFSDAPIFEALHAHRVETDPPA
jgi:gentisate 1,2-dioxygenase